MVKSLNTNCKVERGATYELWNINCIHGSGWYIIVKVWKIYNDKIEAVFFCHRVWEELINGVKIEVDVKMLFLLSPVRKVWIINWQNIIFAAFFGCVSFIGFCMNSDTEEWRKKMDKERGRICSYRTASDLLNSNILMTSTLGKYFVQLSKL
jgi:hypothetical protein